MDTWILYKKEQENAKAVSDPTADSDPSKGSKGAKASDSNDSSKSSEDSAVVEDPAERYVEALIARDEAKKQEIKEHLQKRKERYLEERAEYGYIAWRKGEQQREASRNKTPEQTTAKVNKVAADYEFMEAVKSPRVEQHEAASKQKKEIAAKEEEEKEETRQDGEKDGASEKNKAKERRRTNGTEERRKNQEERMSSIGRRRGEGGEGRDGGKEEQEEEKTMQLHMKEGEREEESGDVPWLKTASIGYGDGQMYLSQENKETAAVAAGTAEKGRPGSGSSSSDTWDNLGLYQ